MREIWTNLGGYPTNQALPKILLLRRLRIVYFVSSATKSN